MVLTADHGSAMVPERAAKLGFGGGQVKKLAGPAFRPGQYGRREMVDFAATLAHVLGVSPLAACEGEVITAALR